MVQTILKIINNTCIITTTPPTFHEAVTRKKGTIEDDGLVQTILHIINNTITTRIPEKPVHNKRQWHTHCKHCHKPSKKKYCSEECKEKDYNSIRTIRVINGKLQLRRMPHYQPKNCKWCGKQFTPKHSSYKYCSIKCRAYGDMDSNMLRVREYRRKYRNVLKERVVNTVIGTRRFGGHMCADEDEELNKIRKELRELGLTRGLSSY